MAAIHPDDHDEVQATLDAVLANGPPYNAEFRIIRPDTREVRWLVGRLLAFARRQHLEARPVLVQELIEGMRELVDRSLGPQIEVRLDLPARLPRPWSIPVNWSSRSSTSPSTPAMPCREAAS